MTMLVPTELIASKIYLIRGIKMMLDRDLAELYSGDSKPHPSRQTEYREISP